MLLILRCDRTHEHANHHVTKLGSFECSITKDRLLHFLQVSWSARRPTFSTGTVAVLQVTKITREVLEFSFPLCLRVVTQVVNIALL